MDNLQLNDEPIDQMQKHVKTRNKIEIKIFRQLFIKNWI